MQTVNHHEQHNGDQASTRAEPWPGLGYRAQYLFGRTAEPVRFLRVTAGGSAIVVFGDGRLDAVTLHRVRLLP